MSAYDGKEQNPEEYRRFQAFCIDLEAKGQAARTTGTATIRSIRTITDPFEKPAPATNLDHLGRGLVRYLREADRDRDVHDAYAAIKALGDAADTLAKVIERVEHHERTALESLGSRLVEVRDRLHAHAFDDNVAALDARFAEEDRIRTQASDARREALENWYAACRTTGEVLTRVTSSLGNVPDCPHELKPVDERSSPQAARDELNRNYTKLLQHEIDELGNDPVARKAYWDELPDDRKRALLASAPHVIKIKFWPFLVEGERHAFSELHPFIERETEWTAEAKVEVDAVVAGLGASVKLTMKTAESSNRTFEVTFELKAEGEAEFGVWLVGEQRSRAFTARFASEAELESFKARLDAAFAADGRDRDLTLSATRAVLAEIGTHETGWGSDDQVTGGIGKDFGPDAAALTAKLGFGSFHDGINGEKGVYTKTALKAEGRVPVASGEAQASYETRFLYDRDGRPFVVVKGEVEAWATAHLPPGVHLPGGVPPGGVAVVTVTAKVAVTDTTRPHLESYLRNTSDGTVTPLDVVQLPHALRGLAEHADVTTTVKTGTLDKTDSGTAGVHGNVSIKQLQTAHATRKPPGFDTYTQTD